MWIVARDIGDRQKQLLQVEYSKGEFFFVLGDLRIFSIDPFHMMELSEQLSDLYGRYESGCIGQDE